MNDGSAFDVLHALRVRGFADEGSLEESTGLEQTRIGAVLERVRDEGWALHREGRVTGWRLTPAGRDEHARQLAVAMADAALRDRVEAAHHQFVPLNAAFKELCTNWQLRASSPSGDDEAAGAALVAGVSAVHGSVRAAIDPVAERLASFAAYLRRFDSALARLERGQWDALARPLTGSYHDVWMELHQDLILRLDLQRTDADV